MTQIGKGFVDGGHAIPVVHTAALIDWATGGPMPSVLEEAGFVEVIKSFQGRKPLTTAKMTEPGRKAFVAYLDALGGLMGPR